MDMSGIKEALTRPLGPLPLWGWVLVGGGALYLYKKVKGNGVLSGVISGSSGSSVSTSTDTSAVAGTDDTAMTTNDDWADSAIQYLEGQGYTQTQAQSSIGTYLNGGQLDPSMATLVDSAQQGVGAPPNLVLPTSTTPTLGSSTGVATTTSAGAGTTVTTSPSSPSQATGTTSSSTPAYVQQHQAQYTAAGATVAANGPVDTSGHKAYFRYTVKKGDTLSTIASKFGSGAKQIETWNGLKTGTVKTGQTIWV
jgi:LysM repeat protein